MQCACGLSPVIISKGYACISDVVQSGVSRITKLQESSARSDPVVKLQTKRNTHLQGVRGLLGQ